MMKKSMLLFACLLMFFSCIPTHAQPNTKRAEIVFHKLTAQDTQLIKQNKSLQAWVSGYAKKSAQMGGGGLDDIRAANFGNGLSTLILSAPVLGPGFDRKVVVGLDPVFIDTIAGAFDGTKYFIEYSKGSDGLQVMKFQAKDSEPSSKAETVFTCREGSSQAAPMQCSSASR